MLLLHHQLSTSKPPSLPFLFPFFSSPPPPPARSLCHLHTNTLHPTRLRIRPILCTTTHAEPISPTVLPPSHHQLKIAIIGFGNYGQFLAKTLVSQGHTVLAHSRSNYSEAAKRLGVSFFEDPHDVFKEHPEVILLCSSISSTKQVLKSLPLQHLERNTLFVDVLSVKEFAKNLFLEALPLDSDILCTHPMFGPESAMESWNGHSFMYEKVRIGNEESRVSRCDKFLDVFAKEGCKMVEISCSEHDLYAAGSQFITHTVGRVLETLKLKSTPINTKGYEALLDLMEKTARDSFDLSSGLFTYNKYALNMLVKLDSAFKDLKKKLMDSLHEELFGSEEKEQKILLENLGNGTAIGADKSNHTRSNGALQSHEHKARASGGKGDSSKLKIAIVGFGNFGQFLAKTIIRQGHTVLAFSRTDYSDVAPKMGVSFFSSADDLCEEDPEVILFCTSILSTEKVLKSLPLQKLKRNTLFVDVLSVKKFPRHLFLKHLPPYFDILCTHPMFGPQSGKNGWNGLPFVFDRVRVGSDESRVSRCNGFLEIFAREGCRMVEMRCEIHDEHAAGSQFITHTIGRILEELKLESTPINTKAYETLLKLVENTARDSFDLYNGLFLFNANAMEHLKKLDLAFETLKLELFGRLHGLLLKERFDNSE